MLWNPTFVISMLDFELGTPSWRSLYECPTVWNTPRIWNTSGSKHSGKGFSTCVNFRQGLFDDFRNGSVFCRERKLCAFSFLFLWGENGQERGGSLSDTSWCRLCGMRSSRAPGLEGGAAGGLPAGVTLCSLLSTGHTGARKALTILLNQDEKEMKSYLLL